MCLETQTLRRGCRRVSLTVRRQLPRGVLMCQGSLDRAGGCPLPPPPRHRRRLLGTTHSRDLPQGPASSEERTGSVARPVRRQGGRTGDQESPMGGGSPSQKVSEGEAPPAPHLPPDRALKSKYVSPLVPFYPCVFIWGETFHIHNIHTFMLCHGTPFLHQAPFNLSISEESLSRRSNPNLWIL